MTVYADVLVILNTLVNYFMLLAVRKLSRAHTKRFRILLGAILGGVSSLLLFVENLGIYMTLLKIISAFAMVYVCFGYGNIKTYFKRTFWLFAVCFVFGGLMFAFYMIFKKDIMLYSNGIVYFDINMTFLIACTVISYIVITIVERLVSKKAPKQSEYYVTIEKGGEIVSATGLMDTGNNLTEPFSSLPVIMIEKSLFNKLSNSTPKEKIRYIPVMTVNGESLIKAIKPDKVIIDKWESDNVYVGESIKHLSEYKIILNINLEGEIHNE